MRVALFATCLANQFFADACVDATRLLRHLGVQVDVPPAQSCCGQPAYNSGHAADAARMARHTLKVFAGADYVVLPSGSCAGMIRNVYRDLLKTSDGGDLEQLTARTFELSQFLVHVLGAEALGTGLRGHRVAYHHGCHALRELCLEEEPVRLLTGVGAEVVPWEADRECCGFGGLFSTKLPEVSGAMADRKLDTLPSVHAVTSTDGGCLLQLSGRAGRRALEMPFVHIASLLWRGVNG